jgi:hypothetical protein
MTSTVTAYRLRWFPLLGSAEARERSIRRRVAATWGLLVLNVLAFAPGISILKIPHVFGQVITQGALSIAVLLALSVNRRVIVRPSIFLALLTLLVIDGVLTCLQAKYFGTVYRTFRLAEFVVVLWLLSPWWGRRDMLLVRCHLVSMWVVLGSVVLGLLVAPGRAFISGRLNGVLWPIPDTQLAHYSAIAIGMTAVLWLSGLLRGRIALIAVTAGLTILLLAHTRTALVAMMAGLLVAGLSLFAAKARVRKLFAAVAVAVSLAIMTLAGVLTNWLARGQSSEELNSLSGRTKFWDLVVSLPRTRFQEIFGFGLSNGSVSGFPIDSNWFAAYMEQGFFGVTIAAMIFLFLLVTAYFRPSGVARALALFLITYCLLASITEVQFGDATSYILDLTVAASLLVPSAVSTKSA